MNPIPENFMVAVFCPRTHQKNKPWGNSTGGHGRETRCVAAGLGTRFTHSPRFTLSTNRSI